MSTEEGRFVLDAERNLLRVAGRPFPVDPTETEVSDFPTDVLPSVAFRTRRCRVVFENRWELSVIWGSGTYSSNHDAWEDDFEEEPATVEVMVFAPDDMTANEDGEPYGYVSAEAFLELAEVCSRQSSSPTIDVSALRRGQ